MVDRIGPVDAVSNAPSYNGRWERQLRSVHQAMGSTGRPLGVRTGVRPGTPATTVTATSTTWTCQPFAGEADVEAAAEASGYPFSFDAVKTGAMTPADGTNPRIDILYVQIDDPAEGDGSSAPAVSLVYKAGVANASPTAPSPTVTRAFVIAQFNVPKSGSGSPTVTWVAPYTAGAGGIVPFNTLDQLNLWTTAAPYQKAVVINDPNVQNLGEYSFVGGQWLQQVPGLARLSPASIANTGGSAALGAGGLVTFTNVTAISLNGFATAAFEAYRVVVEIDSASADADLYIRLRQAGVDYQSATYNRSSFDLQSGGGTSTAQSGGSQVAGVAGRISTQGAGIVHDVHNLARATFKRATGQSFDNNYLRSCGWAAITAGVYDGLTLFTSTGATFTGRLRVYGYNGGF